MASGPMWRRRRAHRPVKSTSHAVRPFAMVGQYVNFLGREADYIEAQAVAAYGAAKVERLRAIKEQYDPGNRFRANHNIRPR